MIQNLCYNPLHGYILNNTYLLTLAPLSAVELCTIPVAPIEAADARVHYIHCKWCILTVDSSQYISFYSVWRSGDKNGPIILCSGSTQL